MQRTDSLEKTLILGKIEGRRRRGRQRMRWLDGITDSMDMGLGGLQELMIGRPSILWFMGLQKVRHNWATELRLTILCAKSLQSCPTLCYPIDGSPQGSPIPGILQARTLE